MLRSRRLVNRTALTVNRTALTVNRTALTVNRTVLTVNRTALTVNRTVLTRVDWTWRVFTCWLLTDQKEAELVRGQSAVMSVLGKLPATQHSPESFIVDVAISMVTAHQYRFMIIFCRFMIIFCILHAVPNQHVKAIGPFCGSFRWRCFQPVYCVFSFLGV